MSKFSGFSSVDFLPSGYPDRSQIRSAFWLQSHQTQRAHTDTNLDIPVWSYRTLVNPDSRKHLDSRINSDSHVTSDITIDPDGQLFSYSWVLPDTLLMSNSLMFKPFQIIQFIWLIILWLLDSYWYSQCLWWFGQTSFILWKLTWSF